MGNRKKQMHKTQVSRMNYAQKPMDVEDRDDGFNTFIIRYFRGK